MDLLKFGPGWQKLQKFEFEINGNHWMPMYLDPSYVPGYQYSYEICCENLKHLRLAHIITEPEIGLRFLLGKCKALETLHLEYVIGLDESEMIALFQRCSNLKSISLWLMPLHLHSVHHGFQFRTPLTNVSLEALALSCPMLEVVELTFTFCDPDWPTEIGFTQKGILTLIQSCPIRALVLNGASIFYNSGMKGLSSCQFLETLEIVDCVSLTDAGMDFVIQAPRLSILTLRECNNVTDNGMVALARSGKLEALTVIGCRQISQEGVNGAAKSVHYSEDVESHDCLKGIKIQWIVHTKRGDLRQWHRRGEQKAVNAHPTGATCRGGGAGSLVAVELDVALVLRHLLAAPLLLLVGVTRGLLLDELGHRAEGRLGDEVARLERGRLLLQPRRDCGDVLVLAAGSNRGGGGGPLELEPSEKARRRGARALEVARRGALELDASMSWELERCGGEARDLDASRSRCALPSQFMKRQCTMEDLPEPLLAEVVKRITRASDRKSLSLVSKQLYAFEAEHRDAIRIGCGLNPATQALKSLFSRFPNLCKVEINYSGWTSSHGEQLNKQGLRMLSSHCPLLSDLTLTFAQTLRTLV
ncbi:hypothetical protein ACQ4PT_001401 [Festuca glaucescens]